MLAFALHLYFAHKYEADLETLQRQVESLEAENAEQAQIQLEHKKRYGEAFRDLLHEIGKGRGLSTGDRISVYKLRENESGFVLLGRYSPNEKYGKPGRGTYPVDSGLLAEAREKLPPAYERLPHPESEIKEYIRWHREHGLKAAKAKALKMKSRSYYFYQAADLSGTHNSALVVLESTEPKLALRKQLKRADIEEIQSFIKLHHDNEPTIDPGPKGF